MSTAGIHRMKGMIRTTDQTTSGSSRPGSGSGSSIVVVVVEVEPIAAAVVVVVVVVVVVATAAAAEAGVVRVVEVLQEVEDKEVVPVLGLSCWKPNDPMAQTWIHPCHA